ncbi:MAG: ABC transporter ATP-binding protein [Abditibacteriales bacterium]|nr:ABC transporter ATP-binding protein [Abditibacteriales bacterium]MDW8364697.1 ABC transporter ATP-binding protein [Abditibacteriales bacterium]
MHLDHVAKAYTMGEVVVHALRDVTLDIHAGEFVVLLGPSGSGKTTLLNIVGGLDTPTSGRVLVRGQDIATFNETQLTTYRRQMVGFIFQFFNLIPTLTAQENVELVAELVGKREQARRRLEQVGLGERAHHFPSELSGGEQQRVAIARALAKEPELILGDEPTGNLDYETSLRVLRALRDINRQQHKTMLIVTHNSALAQMADTIIRLRSGRVVEVKRNDNPLEPEELQW